MERTMKILLSAFSTTAVMELVQIMLLEGKSGSITAGRIILVVLVLVAGTAGVLAAYANLFAKKRSRRHGFGATWKRLGLTVLWMLPFGLGLTLLLGLVAMLLGRWLPIDPAKGIIDWVSSIFVLLAIPVGLHAFYRAGLFADSFRESFETLRSVFLPLLGISAATFGLGRLLAAISWTGWFGVLIGLALQTCAIVLILRLYQKQNQDQTDGVRG